jgi:hypothetical protein
VVVECTLWYARCRGDLLHASVVAPDLAERLDAGFEQ